MEYNDLSWWLHLNSEISYIPSKLRVGLNKMLILTWAPNGVDSKTSGTDSKPQIKKKIMSTHFKFSLDFS